MLWFILLVIVLLFTYFFLNKAFSPKHVKITGKHVLITGGSSGIGKALAIHAAQLGANVTIFARNKLKLEEAKTEIQQHLQTDRKVCIVSVDLAGDYGAVQKAVQEVEEKQGPVFMVINSAGGALSRSFVDHDAGDFKKQMEMNYFSAINTTKAVVNSMIQQQEGRIVFLSSQAGQIGLFGFTAYSGSKFALRGMAEALQMEMTPHNIRVTVAFPPDTDTPGLNSEMDGKPKETVMISETAGLWNPADVAKKILNDSLAGQFVSYQGLDGWLLANISAGMTPATSALDVVTQFLMMGIMRVVGLFYLASFDQIVLKCKKERDAVKPKSS